jgi:hypothetical protein
MSRFSNKISFSRDWIRVLVVIFFFDFTTVEMALSKINDIHPFVQRRDLLSNVNGGYESLDLTSSYRFWNFSLSCHEEVCPRDIFSLMLRSR